MRFFSYHQPRRIRVIENTLCSRRTVATLFWARQYDILKWLGAYRSLTRHEFNDLIDELVHTKILTLNDKSEAKLTEKGAAILKKEEADRYEPAFFDWYWLANTHRVVQRLLLAVQVASEYSYHQNKYAPLTIPLGEMQVVKQWFRNNYQYDLTNRLYLDLQRLGKALDSEDPRLATDLFNSLIGYKKAGWTPNQAAANLKLSLEDIQFLRHDEMLAVSAYARNFPGPLQQLLGPLLRTSPLNRSAEITYNLYAQGQEIEQISQRRRLKQNTIQEHLLEAAILIPEKVNWNRFLPEDKRIILGKAYEGVPTTWKFNENVSSFYEFRLYQIYQGVVNEE
nr:helix-turn-helix domain-containing protein [Limosilactobacillus rudii]